MNACKAMNELPLHWSIDTNPIVNTPAVFDFEAAPSELRALKDYAEVEDISSFKAHVKAAPLGSGKFRVSGTFQAQVVQSSVVDLSAVPSTIEESFSLEYWPADLIAGAPEEAAPFDADPPKPIVGGHIPAGELLCELLAVSINPYPRNEGDSFEWTPPHPEPETSPFAGLARLKPPKAAQEE